MTATFKIFHTTKLHMLVTLLVIGLLLTGCQSSPPAESSQQNPQENVLSPSGDNQSEANTPSGSEPPETSDPSDPASAANQLSDEQLNTMAVNELGDVMVLMYHIIGDKEDEWERTKDNFRNDLKVLYEEGYYLVTARDFVTGTMDVPAGKTPVILTFDDATEGHFRFIEGSDGTLTVDPDCAVGIIENFAKEHPDFGIAASFYVYYPVPFRQNDHPEWRQKKYEYLTNLGMEIGNHAYSHENLSKLTDEEVQQALMKNIQSTQAILPDYSVDTLALPYGISPKTKQLAATGSYEGMQYDHKGVLLVGSNPAPSPFSQDFNLLGIPRIRAASVPDDFFNQWISHFQNNPEKRYISDGDPASITIPKELENLVDTERFPDKNIRIYETN